MKVKVAWIIKQINRFQARIQFLQILGCNKIIIFSFYYGYYRLELWMYPKMLSFLSTPWKRRKEKRERCPTLKNPWFIMEWRLLHPKKSMFYDGMPFPPHCDSWRCKSRGYHWSIHLLASFSFYLLLSENGLMKLLVFMWFILCRQLKSV